MNHWGIRNRFLAIQIIFGILFTLVMYQAHGMEVVGIAEEAAEALRGAGVGEESTLFRAAEESIIEKFGNLSAEEMTNLGEDIRSTLKSNLKDMAEKIKAEFSGEKDIGEAELKADVEKQVIGTYKEQFFKSVESRFPAGVDEFTGEILNKIGDVPEGFKAKFGDVDSLHYEAANQGIEPVPGAEGEAVNAGTPSDKVLLAEDNLKNFLKNPGKIDVETFNTQVEEFKGKITEAKKEFNNSAQKESDAAQTAVQDARLKEISSDQEFQNAKATDQNVEAAKKDLADAKANVAKAEKAAREVEVRKAYEEYQQAKAAETSAKQELDTAKKLFEGNKEEIAKYQKAYDDAQAATKEARDGFIKQHSWLKEGWGKYATEKLKASLPSLKDEAWATVKGTGKGAWQAGKDWVWSPVVKPALEGFFQAGVFLVPQMLMDKFQAWLQSQADSDTIHSPQIFAGVTMKVPETLIDEAEPRLSKFVYVGVPSKNQQLTNDFLQSANYYVSKSDFGDLAAFAITDPNFPHVMMHLNTGFVFVGDGVALKEEEPTVPLLETTQSSEKTLKQSLDDISGEVKNGSKTETVGQWFGLNASGYAGDPEIASLFATPEPGNDKSYAPILQRLVVVLQNGTQFGDFIIQGIRGLNTKNKNDIAMWNLISQGSASEKALGTAALDEPYVGLEIYIYQTKDTPFIKNISSSLASDDPDTQIAAQNLVDYVVVLDENFNPIPLQVPRGTAPYNYASYILNPDAVYMVSLLDPSLRLYAKQEADSGKLTQYKELPELWSAVESAFVKKNGALQDMVQQLFSKQIAPMQQFIEQQAQYGPFSVGAVTLTITKDLLAKGIYIYKIADYLGKGIDDYVIAVDPKTGKSLQLPASVPNFVSLVTSRIYDGAFKPAMAKIPYYVMLNPDGAKKVTTSLKGYLEKLPTAQQFCPSKKDVVEKAPLYTLFVESALNPTRCEGNPLPTQESWALEQYGFMDQSGNPKTIDVELLKVIKESHDHWKIVMEKTDPSIITRQMGPFRFTPEDAVQDVEITAFSEAAIMNQNFVYTSDLYAGELLVLATDAQGAGVGAAYDPGNPQRFAVSLSNGNVYSALAQAGKVPGERVNQKPLDLQKILAQAQETEKFTPELLAAIQHSEKVYNARIANELYGAGNDFGQFKFYIAKDDYLASQFIYADVTQFGSPLDQNGDPIPAVISQISDYYICIERTASTENCGSGCPPVMIEGKQATDDNNKPLYWQYDFANKISGDTYAVASLITGASYDRNGTYIGSYDQFKIEGNKVTNLEGFTTGMLKEVETKSGQPARLRPEITKLLQSFVDRIKQEEKELAEADQEVNKLLKTNLNSNLKATLDKLPYIDNPNLLPRYLKYNATAGKYYSVTPGYLTTPKPTDSKGNPIDVPSDGPGPDRTYTDYNVDVVGSQRKDSYGVMYNSDGVPVLLLGPDKKWLETTETDPVTKQKVTKRKKVITGPGWALQMARAYAGINVDASGNQTHTIGISTPSIPMGDKPGTANYLISAGFAQIADSKHNTTFDFLYHTQLDSFFVKVTPPSKQIYYLNLSTGYSYNPDGSPRWFESPIFSTKNGDMLLIGYDQFDILKIALYQAKTKQFAYYTMVGRFKAQIAKDPYNAAGTYCVMVNDNDPDSKIQLFQATNATSQGRAPLAQPYYLVWDVSTVGDATTATPQLLGQFLKDDQRAYSLLLYAQTRNKGEPLEKGKFVEDDNFIDVTADVKKPKTVGIIFDKNHAITNVIYEDQIGQLQGSSLVLNNSDGTSHTVQLTQNKKSLGSPTAPALKDLVAQWISLEDNGKVYDYEYDISILDPQPEASAEAQSATHFNLYNLKHGNPSDLEQGLASGGFGLNVTPYVPTSQTAKSKAEPKTAVSGVALASYLNLPLEGASLPTPKNGFQQAAYKNLDYISVDSSGSLFINNIVSGPTTRFVYRLGQSQDVNKSYATPGIYGWYVDMSNGILYDTKGFPTGISLNAPQLLTLLNTLQLSVVNDSNGKPQLIYRMVPIKGATPAPSPQSKIRTAVKRTAAKGKAPLVKARRIKK